MVLNPKEPYKDLCKDKSKIISEKNHNNKKSRRNHRWFIQKKYI